MKRKIIRNWKVIGDNLDCRTAINIFKKKEYNGQYYDIIGIKLYSNMFQSGVHNIDNESFDVCQILSNKWEIIIPDDAAEEKTNKLRQMLKDKNFAGLRYDKIDNMSIDEMWDAIIEQMSRLDKDNKYRIAKHIIETGLYKKI